MADRRADPGQLAGGDRRADAGAADEHGALGLAALDRLADLARLVGVVDPDRVGVGAEVDHLVPDKRLEHRVAQVHAAVVERDGDLHRTSTRAILPSSKVKRIGSDAAVRAHARDRVAVVAHLDRLELQLPAARPRA